MGAALMLVSCIMIILAATAVYYSFRCYRQTTEILAKVERVLARGEAGNCPATPKVLFEKQIAIHPNQTVSRLDINLGVQEAKKQ